MSNNLYSLRSEEQKEYYNQTAQHYDQWHLAPPSAKVVDAWNFKNLQNFLPPQKIGKTLDLGCGTGRLSNNLLSISQEVYGVDFSAEVLKIAQKKYPTLRLSCAEVVNLPYENDYFDLVVINGSLHHFFALAETLKEAHRVLKTNGYLVLLGEPNKNFLQWYNPFFYGWVLNRVVNKILTIWRPGKNKQELIEPRAESYRPRQLKKYLATAGFKIVSFYSYDYWARSNNQWWLKIYPHYLNFEHRSLAKVFPFLGSALQLMASKK